MGRSRIVVEGRSIVRMCWRVVAVPSLPGVRLGMEDRWWAWPRRAARLPGRSAASRPTRTCARRPPAGSPGRWYSGAVTRASTLLRTLALGLALAACAVAPGEATGLPPAELRPETLEAWNRYVRAAEARIERDLRAAAAKPRPDPPGADAGAPAIARVAGEDAEGGIDVPSGTVHHWRGRVLLEGATLDAVLAFVEDPERLPAIQEDVVAARVLERGDGRMRLYLRLVRKAIVTVTYDTEYDVTWGRVAPRVAFSRSIATRIVEIDNPGTPRERARQPGEDHGYLWRLNAYWRYEQTDQGVVATLESLSLSRGVPFVLAPIVKPIVNRIARESVRRALDALQKGVAQRRGAGA